MSQRNFAIDSMMHYIKIFQISDLAFRSGNRRIYLYIIDKRENKMNIRIIIVSVD